MAGAALPFACPRCGRRMGVRPESAGRPVRCPHCKEVVVAPAAAPRPPEPPPPPPPAVRFPEFDAGPREQAESIFSEHKEEESVFESAPAAKVEMPEEPPAADVPPDPAAFVIPVPAPPPPPPPSAEPADPWAALAGPTPPPAAKPPPAPPPPEPAVPDDARTIRRLKLALAAVAVYAALATVVGVWGWVRGGGGAKASPGRAGVVRPGGG